MGGSLHKIVATGFSQLCKLTMNRSEVGGLAMEWRYETGLQVRALNSKT